MKIINEIFNRFKSLLSSGTAGLEKDFHSYLDSETEVFGTDGIPKPFKFEAAAALRRLTNGRKFDEKFISELGLSNEGELIFKSMTVKLLRFAEAALGNKKTKNSPLQPWQCALFISPNIHPNATICTSSDESQNVIFIFINAGLILEVCHRVCAVFSRPEFWEVLNGQHQNHIKDADIVDGNIRWMNILPQSDRIAHISLSVIEKSLIMVLFHELAHFYRGHLGYLHCELNCSASLNETNEAYEANETQDNNKQGTLARNTRRLLELDADQFSGKLSSAFWRLLDYPAKGPEDAQIESFYMEILASTISVFLIINDNGPSDEYYSAIWRAHHFIENFNLDFFVNYAPDNPADESGNTKIHTQLYELIFAFEAAYKALNWGDGFSNTRLEAETRTLLESDSIDLKNLTEILAKYFPFTWTFVTNEH